MADHPAPAGVPMAMGDVWESAARLQSLVPDAVPVGGSAGALYANHRVSFDHDDVIGDLRDRIDAVLEALESEPDWVTNRVTPGKINLGQIGDIETGVRQLIRTRPLEVATVTLLSGRELVVPTSEKVLRVKGFLLVRRNQVRDYLDVAALADRYGISESAVVLRGIDDYYSDQRQMAGLAALERGGVSEWAPLIAAIRTQPWGTVAQRVEQALEIQQPYGVAPLMRRALAQAREAQRHAPPEP